MALTKEILTAQSALNGLTDEQINAIVTLSVNDEDAVIGKRFGEVYREMDNTIKEATGIDRNGDEKTYVYLKRATTELREKAKSTSNLTKEIDELKAEKSRLENVIKEGAGNEETKKALEQAKKDLTAITKQFTTLKNQYDEAEKKHNDELFGIRVDNELKVATKGLKFKSELPTSVTDVILRQVTDKVKGMNPEFIDDGKGGQVLAFKDETGAILRNANNQLMPFSASDLVAKELKEMGVLDEVRKQTGAGTTGGGTGGNHGGSFVADVTGAKTRTEAYDIIAEGLMAQGLTNGSKEFDDAMQQAWKDNNVSALPER